MGEKFGVRVTAAILCGMTFVLTGTLIHRDLQYIIRHMAASGSAFVCFLASCVLYTLMPTTATWSWWLRFGFLIGVFCSCALNLGLFINFDLKIGKHPLTGLVRSINDGVAHVGQCTETHSVKAVGHKKHLKEFASLGSLKAIEKQIQSLSPPEYAKIMTELAEFQLGDQSKSTDRGMLGTYNTDLKSPKPEKALSFSLMMTMGNKDSVDKSFQLHEGNCNVKQTGLFNSASPSNVTKNPKFLTDFAITMKVFSALHEWLGFLLVWIVIFSLPVILNLQYFFEVYEVTA